MMELKIATFGQDKDQGTVNVSAAAFGREFNEALVHQVIVAYQAGGRAGTRAQKTRAEVRGRGTMSSILSELIRQGRLTIVAAMEVAVPKTRELIMQLKNLGLKEALLVTEDVTENLYLAARNIPNVDVRDVSHADPVSLINFSNVVMTVAAIKRFEELLI